MFNLGGNDLIRTDAIILDVDGTIWDSTNIVADAWNEAAREMDADYDEITPDILKGYFGKTMEEIAEGLFSRVETKKSYKLMRLCEQKEQEYLQNDPCSITYDGVKTTVRELSEKINIFVVSNCQKGYIELMLEKTGLADCITDFECYGNTGNGKADNIKLLVERNNLKNPVYVGDTGGDAAACKEAGVPFIFASYGFGSVDEYTAKIDSFSELKTLLSE